jgi:hypothetical protein
MNARDAKILETREVLKDILPKITKPEQKRK